MRKGETRAQMEDPARIAQLLSPWIAPESLSIERKAVYRFHARCCQRFQEGRCSSSATPPTSPRPSSARAWWPACVTRPTWPGSSPGCCRAAPRPRCSTATTRSGAPCAGDDRPGQADGQPGDAEQCPARPHGARFDAPDALHPSRPPAPGGAGDQAEEPLPTRPVQAPADPSRRQRRAVPQALVRDAQNRIRLSDDLLGTALPWGSVSIHARPWTPRRNGAGKPAAAPSCTWGCAASKGRTRRSPRTSATASCRPCPGARWRLYAPTASSCTRACGARATAGERMPGAAGQLNQPSILRGL